MPVPMSCVPQATRAVPSSRSSTLAAAGNRAAIHAAPGHSPAERQPIALHRADFRVAFRPAKFFRAELKTLEVMTRRKRKA